MGTFSLDLNHDNLSVDDVGGEVRITFSLIGPTEVSERRDNIDAAFKEALEGEAEDGWLDDRVALDLERRLVSVTVTPEELERGLTALDRAVISADEIVSKGVGRPLDVADLRSKINDWVADRAATRSPGLPDA